MPANSASSEDLLVTLVELKKEQMRRTRNHRTVHFLMITLPTFLLILFSVWGGIKIVQSSADIIDSLPGFMSDNLSEQVTNQLEELKRL